MKSAIPAWMRGWLLFLAACSFSGVLMMPKVALADAVADGVRYLLQRRDISGAFGVPSSAGAGSATGGNAEESVVTTQEVLRTLRALGMGGGFEAAQAELYLAGAAGPLLEAELRARRAFALDGTSYSVAPEAQSAFADGFASGDVQAILYALRALRHASPEGSLAYTSNPALYLAQQLIASGRPSGCFGLVENDDDIALTAEVAMALDAFAYDSAVDAAHRAALVCLRGAQRTDGSFGPGASADAGARVVPTALATLALLESAGDANSGAAIASARQFLLAAQNADGSWGGTTGANGGLRATALALRALGTTGPDWRPLPNSQGVGVLAFDNPEPIQGSAVVAKLSVENRAGSPAPATYVRFLARPLNGGAEQALADVLLPAMAAGEVVPVRATLSTAALAGRYTVRAVVDPMGAVPELDELNNQAQALLNVRMEYDLAVSTTSLRFVPAGAGQAQVDVTITNLGVALPAAVTVDIYRGSPSTGVKLFTGAVPQGMALNQSVTVSATFSTSSLNGPTPIYAVVDAANALNEADETNNQAFRYYYPGTESPVDLAVSSSTISTSSPVVMDQPFTVFVPVRNLSTTYDVNRVSVAVRVGTGRVLGMTEIPFIAKGGTAIAEVTATLSANDTLIAEVDPEARLNDPSRTNNSAQFSVAVKANGPVELVAGALTADSVSGEPNRRILKLSLQNTGTETASTTVRVTDEEGQLELARVGIAAATGLGTTFNLGTYSLSNGRAIFKACVDPDNAFDEVNENDNCAELTVSTGASADLSVDPKDLTFSPVGADIGEKVRLSVVVRNKSSTAATGTLEWWHGRPAGREGVLLGSSALSIPANGSTVVERDWIRAEGVPEVFVRLARVMPADSQASNQFAGRNLYVEAIVNLAGPSPDLGTVQPTATSFVRVGKVTGSETPELVLGYRYRVGHASSIQVLQRSSSGDYQELWKQTRLADDNLEDLALVDLDSDGAPEVLALWKAYTFYPSNTLHLIAYRTDGSVKWDASWLPDSTNGSSGHFSMGLGDINGDGVVDIAVQDVKLHVLSGSNGQSIFTAVTSPTASASSDGTAIVLDVDGDGVNEVLGMQTGEFLNETTYYLMDRQGQIRWLKKQGLGIASSPSIVDVDGDGSPEAIFPTYAWVGNAKPFRVVDLRTGNIVGVPANHSAYFYPVPVGPVRQDGLPYVVQHAARWDAPMTAAYAPDLTPIWDILKAPTPITEAQSGTDFWSALLFTMADLTGKGRPQLIGLSGNQAFTLQDSRTGRHLITALNNTAISIGDNSILPENGGSLPGMYQQLPVVSDLANDGRARVVAPYSGFGPSTNSPYGPYYGYGQALVFSSAHWKKQPTAWPTRHLVKGRIGEDLKMATGAAGYRWWTVHNTWNTQFDVEPAKLLPDLVAVATTPTVTPAAGNTVQLSATVKNVGGLPASDIPVAFYDGDPAQGGKLLGTTTVAGPLAVRGGQATATLSWTAYPEGEHHIYVVANPAGADGTPPAIEESGDENNTSSTRLFVQAPAAGSAVCDLSVVASSLSAAPADAPAGAPLALSATVTNSGTDTCAASALIVYDGALTAGGFQVGVAAIPALAPGQTANAQVVTAAIPGSHLYRFVSDEAQVTLDTNRSNNLATLSFATPSATLPDLLAVALQFVPSPAHPGEAVQAQATVKNAGTPVNATRFELRDGDTVVASGVVPALTSGEVATVTAAVSAPLSSTAFTLVLDAATEVAEFNEANNQVSATLPVQAATLAMTVSAAPANPGAYTQVSISLAVSNADSVAHELSLSVEVRDSAGVPVAYLLSGQRLVAGGPAVTLVPLSWNTEAETPGAYTVHASATEAGRQVAEAVGYFSIASEATGQTQVLADRGTYGPGETVLIQQRATNPGRSGTLTGATLEVTVHDALGQELYSSIRPLPTFPPGGSYDFADTFSLSQQPQAGTYTLNSVLRDASGAAVSEAAGSWEVAAPPAQVVSNTATATAPPSVGIGAPLSVTVHLANDGTTALSGGQLVATVVDANSLQVQASATQTVSLAAGASQDVLVTVPTAGLSEGSKLLLIQLDGRTITRLLVEAAVAVDTEPPLITVTGVSDLLLTNGATPVVPVVSVVDQSAFTQAVLLDGQPFVAGTAVTGEGEHQLFVTATDVYSNTSQLLVRFTLDLTPPVVTLTGVADGAAVNAPVTLAYSASDAHPGSTTATLDGAPFASGGVVTSEGPHALVVTATDAAGNTATATRSFRLDLTPPEATVTGVAEGAYVNAPVTLAFGGSDTGGSTATTAALDGVALEPGTTTVTVTAEGVHTLVVTVTDEAGNSTTTSRSFLIDTTAPAVETAGVASGALSNQAPTLTYSATDSYLAQVTATLDGVPFTSGDFVGTEGAHVLVVTATDLAGNVTTETLAFVLDFTPPALAISGAAEGAYLNQPVALAFSATDAHPGVTTATLDGAPYASGQSVTTEGPHVLAVTSVDAAGNVSTATRSFFLDFTAPTVSLSGVTAGALSNLPALILFGGDDGTGSGIASVTATLDGQPFSSGTLVTAEGAHVLVVTAVDLAGNTATREAAFELDYTAPDITVSGVVDGAYLNQPVALFFEATDAHPGTTTATLDGAPFASGGVVTGEGSHTLVVTCTDAAGNTASVTRSFTLDFTAPEVTVTGVTDGATTLPPVTVSYSVSDAHLDASATAATLDGAAFTSGAVVTSEGTHTVGVTATDLAGNRNSRSLSFTLSLSPRAVPYAACALESLLLENNGTVRGAVGSQGGLTLQNGSRVEGDAVAGGNLSLSNSSAVTGRGYYGGSFSLSGTASVALGASVATPAPSPCGCGYDMAGAFAWVVGHHDNAQLASSPAISPHFSSATRALSVRDASFVVPGGTYFLSSLSITGTSNVTVAAGQTARLFVEGPVTVRNPAVVGSANGGTLLVISGARTQAGEAVVLENSSNLYLQLYAPLADVTLANTSELVGRLVGRNVTLRNRQSLTLPDSGAGSAPPPLYCP